MEGVGDVLRRPLAWGAVLLAGALGVLMTFSYIGGFLDPTANLEGLEVGIVNEDEPVETAGVSVAAGDQVVESALGEGRREVKFVTYETRSEAVAAIHRNQIIGAIAIGPGFSQSIADIGLAGGKAEPATIDMISNDGAGIFQAQVFDLVEEELGERVNAEANRQLVEVLAGLDVRIEPAGASSLGRPVELREVDEVSVEGKTGRGLAPFYIAVMVTLTGFLATSITHTTVDVMRGRHHFELLGEDLDVELEVRNDRPLEAWATKAVLAVCGAVLGALGITVVSVSILGMPTAGFWQSFAVAALGAVAIALVTLVFLTLFGVGGEIVGVLFTTIFGVPSALGVYPVEALPAFFRFVWSWHPMHYLTDAFRALTFYDGRGDAGLGTAVVVLALWLVGGAVVGLVSAWAIDRRGGRRFGERRVTVPVVAAGASSLEPGQVS